MKKVLYADDEELNLAIVEAFLDEHFEVELVDSGQACLDAVQNNPPDLLLLDHMMPGMDGMQVLQNLKNNGATRSIPVIMVSANAYSEDRQIAIDNGADDYLAKPFEEEELMEVINRFISS